MELPTRSRWLVARSRLKSAHAGLVKRRIGESSGGTRLYFGASLGWCRARGDFVFHEDDDPAAHSGGGGPHMLPDLWPVIGLLLRAAGLRGDAALQHLAPD